MASETTTLKTRIVLRHGTSEQWASPKAKPLLRGEIGIDITKGIIKIGDVGGTSWEKSIPLNIEGLIELQTGLESLSSSTNDYMLSATSDNTWKLMMKHVSRFDGWTEVPGSSPIHFDSNSIPQIKQMSADIAQMSAQLTSVSDIANQAADIANQAIATAGAASDKANLAKTTADNASTNVRKLSSEVSNVKITKTGDNTWKLQSRPLSGGSWTDVAGSDPIVVTAQVPSTLTSDIKTLSDAVGSMADDIKDVSSKVDALSSIPSEVSKLENDLTALSNATSALPERVAKVEQAIGNIEQEVEKLSGLPAKVDALDQTVGTLTSQTIPEITNDVQSLDTKVTDLESKVDQAAQLSDVEEVSVQLTGSIDELSSKTNEYTLSSVVPNSEWQLMQKPVSGDEWSPVAGSEPIKLSAVVPDWVGDLSNDVEDLSAEVSAFRDSNLAKMSADVIIFNCGNATLDISDDELKTI